MIRRYLVTLLAFAHVMCSAALRHTGGSSGPAAGPSGGSSGCTNPTCSSPPCAARLLGDVGCTTVGGTETYAHELIAAGGAIAAGAHIYGPFEAGFTSQQDSIIQNWGCSDPSVVYDSEGGRDIGIAEQLVQDRCGVQFPRIEGNTYYGAVGECGGHTGDYHFHARFKCLYAETGTHSTAVGDIADKKIYGKWEDYSASMLPYLDACGGHFGPTPDDSSSAYHYHVQDAAPFTVGCHGPAANGGLMSVAECRALYSECGDGTETFTIAGVTHQYDRFCPCFDANGLNYGTPAELPSLSTTDISYSATGASPATPAPTDAPATPAPTDAPATPAPTDAPATPAPTDAPATPAPTDAPATPAPTDAPASPTDAPATPAPTEAAAAPTDAPAAPTDAPAADPVEAALTEFLTANPFSTLLYLGFPGVEYSDLSDPNVMSAIADSVKVTLGSGYTADVEVLPLPNDDDDDKRRHLLAGHEEDEEDDDDVFTTCIIMIPAASADDAIAYQATVEAAILDGSMSLTISSQPAIAGNTVIALYLNGVAGDVFTIGAALADENAFEVDEAAILAQYTSIIAILSSGAPTAPAPTAAAPTAPAPTDPAPTDPAPTAAAPTPAPATPATPVESSAPRHAAQGSTAAALLLLAAALCY